ncbi:hypothetical protein ACFY12_13425 [Streptomyces sp. NPDC001339]|uniref:hypothetical protein n=1 Tax=Streptomyces sp. NPDC001339 TaxID=3364563 RepID=UPI00368810A6
MRNRTAQLLTRLLRALIPGHGRHRRIPLPAPPPPVVQAEPPLWDTPLIRPYLIAYERQTGRRMEAAV